MLKTSMIAAGLALALSAGGANALEARAGSAASHSVVAPSLVLSVDWRGPGRNDRRYRYERLGPRQIARQVHRQGFRDIRNIRARGDVYVLRAEGRRGIPVRLVVDAFSGEVIGRTIIDNRHGYGPKYGKGFRPGPSWHFSTEGSRR